MFLACSFLFLRRKQTIVFLGDVFPEIKHNVFLSGWISNLRKCHLCRSKWRKWKWSTWKSDVVQFIPPLDLRPDSNPRLFEKTYATRKFHPNGKLDSNKCWILPTMLIKRFFSEVNVLTARFFVPWRNTYSTSLFIMVLLGFFKRAKLSRRYVTIPVSNDFPRSGHGRPCWIVIVVWPSSLCAIDTLPQQDGKTWKLVSHYK